MPDNLYSPGQKVLSKEGRDNWDAIFGEKKHVLNRMFEPLSDKPYVVPQKRSVEIEKNDRFWFVRDIKDNSK